MPRRSPLTVAFGLGVIIVIAALAIFGALDAYAECRLSNPAKFCFYAVWG